MVAVVVGLGILLSLEKTTVNVHEKDITVA
jgi:hypothetical protein